MALFSLLKDYVRQDKGVTLAVVVRGTAAQLGLKALIPAEGMPVGPLLETTARDQIIQDARNLLGQRTSIVRHYPSLSPLSGEEAGEVDIFFDVYPPASKLIIVGGVHIASELIHFAKPLGLRSYIVDPRTAFATAERFPHADEIIHAWPDEALSDIGLNSETSVVVVTHDPKLDDPALMVALPSPANYVGALGSPKTHAKRVERLLAEGLTQTQVERLRAPIGLNIGGRAPGEIALSIIAEIVAVRNHAPIINREPLQR